MDRVIAAPFDTVLIGFATNDADIFGGVSIDQAVQNNKAPIRELRDHLPGVRIFL